MRFSSAAAFLNWHPKRLAFIGMSGVGKSTLAGYLDSNTWTSFCTDFALANGPLRAELEAFAGPDFPVGANDISILSAYVGKLGDPARGGLPLVEFQRRQARHGTAEREVFSALLDDLHHHQGPAIIDAGGSLVEILDFDHPDPLRDGLCAQLFFVLIEPDTTETQELIARQLQAPKPMFYRPEFLAPFLAKYQAAYGTDPGKADPSDFIRHIFPPLIAARAPRYAALARQGGVRLPLQAANAVRDDAGLLALICQHIDASP